VTETVLYRLHDADDSLLYVGISSRLGRRLDEHAEVKPWWPQVASVTLERFPDRVSATVAEGAAIRSERPEHNVVSLSVARGERERVCWNNPDFADAPLSELVADLVGSQDIADRIGVTRGVVHADFVGRAVGFPAPALKRDRTWLWSWPQVRQWAVRTGRLPE
jgi:predicted GIY-YIG superfamily endonuclease